MADVQKIASALSKRQREAVLRLGVFQGCRWPVSFYGHYNGIHAATLNSLLDKGLVWGRENHSSRWAALLPLGQEVKEHLQAVNFPTL